ncbi:GNAT family N-acetyltransferase [Thalassotalea litorea]|uniref:GNAT family N-acetyltransferase n=1 Tax=Thalassotalea litorea TaxID=2020715 RepID=A0A5R9IR98_9GAMM|nr:GNAT family N-acetyltransferase [Thalassotalea litorea]TLU67129.1 GNAT family N-acetyltransferase [Thalassotalea litorea]
MQIRNATPADAWALSKLMEQSFRDTFSEFNTAKDMDTYCAKNYGKNQQTMEIANPDIMTLLAVKNDSLAGFMQLRPGSTFAHCPLGNPLHLDRIYVAKAFLGTGVGKRLFNEMHKIARTLTCDGVWLGVWEHNPRAIRFYLDFGFQQCGSTTFWLGSDKQRDVLMMKRI